jgi:hypothetical protein
MWISSGLFGMNHFISYWNQSMLSQKLDSTSNVLMGLLATFSL